MNLRILVYFLLGKVREILESLSNIYALAGITVYMATVDETIITTTGTDTYVGNKVDVPLTCFDEYGGMELDVINGWIINNSGKTRKFTFDGIAPVKLGSTPNMSIHFALFKNGAEIQEQTISFDKLVSSDGTGTLGADTTVVLDDGDYIEVYCKTDKLDGSFTAAHIQLRFIEIPTLGFSA